MGVLRSAAHRRAESRFWGVFIFAVHRAFVLGLGARHRGIVDLSEGVIRCVTVFACYSSYSSFFFLVGEVTKVAHARFPEEHRRPVGRVWVEACSFLRK